MTAPARLPGGPRVFGHARLPGNNVPPDDGGGATLIDEMLRAGVLRREGERLLAR